MKLLDAGKYDKVTAPLKKVTINNLFARSVIEQKVNGAVYVDNTEEPGTFYIVHPYGMSLLFGDTGNEDFNSAFLDYALNTFRIRDKYEWLQVFPDSWNKKISVLLGNKLVKSGDNSGNETKNKIEVNTRVNFKFNKEKYIELRNTLNFNSCKIIRTDKDIYEQMQGSVVPKYFWKSPEQFYNEGIGYSLLYEDRLASTAYSSFIHDNQLELGIETIDSFRGRGLAVYTCSALIDYCMANNYEPVWSCRLENTGSYKLAKKLGFEPTIYMPYYRLSN